MMEIVKLKNIIIIEIEKINGSKLNEKGYGKIRYIIIYELNNRNGYYGKLEFEGEYLNGERCGKGTEYFDGMVFLLKENLKMGNFGMVYSMKMMVMMILNLK
jgi:hypothetical protein